MLFIRLCDFSRHDERCGGTHGQIVKISNITINQFYKLIKLNFAHKNDR